METDQHMTRGARAYTLRAQGLAWTEVQAILGANSDSAVVHLAQKHARNQNLPWPIVLPPKEEEPAPPKAIDRLRDQQRTVYELRAAGNSWAACAEGRYSATPHAVTAARRHAARQGLPWPIQVS